MNPNDIIQPVVVVAAIVATALVLKWLFRSPVGEAWAEWIRTRSRRRRHWKGLGGEWLDVPEGAVADEGRLGAVEEQIVGLRAEVAELAERLDFAERMLAERRERKLSAGQ